MVDPIPAPRERPAKDRAERPADKSPARVAFFLVTIAMLVVGGWYLVDGLAGTSKLEDCTMSGRRNCVPPIDTANLGR